MVLEVSDIIVQVEKRSKLQLSSALRTLLGELVRRYQAVLEGKCSIEDARVLHDRAIDVFDKARAKGDKVTHYLLALHQTHIWCEDRLEEDKLQNGQQ